MDDVLREAFLRWQEAQRFMAYGRVDEEGMRKLCSAEMTLIKTVESLTSGDVPYLIKVWVELHPEVRRENACISCWFSSFQKNKHPECITKLAVFFAIEEWMSAMEV